MAPQLVDAEIVRRWAQLGTAALRTHRDEINALNVFPVPDGDTGTNLLLTFQSAQAAELARQGDPLDAADALAAMARGALLGARGNSGVILAQALQAFATEAGAAQLTLARLLTAGASAARAAVADPVEGTALSVLDAAAEVAARDPEAAAEAARVALARTPEQLEKLRLAGVVDAGGRGVVLLLDALVAAWHGRDLQSPPVGFIPTSVPAMACEPDAKYEVMFLADAQDSAAITHAIENRGVSLSVTTGQDDCQVHIHTDEPAAVIAAATEVGQLRNIRMELLAPSSHNRRLVAQAYGSGLVQLLAEAGVQVVAAEPDIRASVQDFVAAAVRTGAAEVVLLPGDADSVPVANLAATELSAQGVLAVVVPTVTLMQTMAAVAVHEPNLSIADAVAEMEIAVTGVTTLSVSQASRDSATPLGEIATGDYLCFVDGQLQSASKDLVDAICAQLAHVGPSELITIVTGRELAESDAVDIVDAVQTICPDAEVSVMAGRQELWLVHIGVE